MSHFVTCHSLASCTWSGTRRLTAAVFLIFCVLLGSACSHDTTEKEPVGSVQIARAEIRPLQNVVETEGVLFAAQQAAIVPKISAPIHKFYVNRGSHVKKDEILAELENRDLTASQQENKGVYEQAQAAYQSTTAMGLPEEIQKAQADEQNAKQALDADQKVYDSRKQLFDQGALPRKDLDQAGVALTAARNDYELTSRHLSALLNIGKEQQLKSAKAQLDSAQGKYLGAEAQLSYSQIRSPIDGVVTDRPLYPGEMASAGLPLLTVMDLREVIAKAHVPQSSAALMRPGDPATIEVPGANAPVKGEVVLVSPALDPNSTTVEIWVKAPNSGEKLRPGTSVKLRIVTETVEKAVAIPANAVLPGDHGTKSVAVVGSDGRVHLRNVTLGVTSDGHVQVAKGLKPGEQVVTTGAYNLPDNTRVQEAPSMPAEPAPASKSSEP
jgi:HlyD family secretion protein